MYSEGRQPCPINYSPAAFRVRYNGFTRFVFCQQVVNTFQTELGFNFCLCKELTTARHGISRSLANKIPLKILQVSLSLGHFFELLSRNIVVTLTDWLPSYSLPSQTKLVSKLFTENGSSVLLAGHKFFKSVN